MIRQPLLPPLIDVSDPAVGMRRFGARVYARVFGYFWLPCPLCGVYFGGHEALHGRSEGIPHIPKLDDPERRTFKVICPWCTRAGRGCDVA